MLPLLITISVLGVLKFLLVLAVLVLLIVGIKYLFSLAGWVIPQPIWIVLGVIVFILLCIWFIGGAEAINFR